MAAITPNNVQEKIEGGFGSICFIVNSATAADTLTISSYLNGRSIVGIRGSNVSDGASLAYTYTAAGVITVPTGPSTDKISVIVDLL